MKRLVAIIGMWLLWQCFFSTVQAQEVRVKVSPASIPGMEHKHTHNLAAAALKSGTTEFRIGGAPDDIHILRLSKAQLQSLLNGTTLIVDTELDASGGLPAHIHRLTITAIDTSPGQQENSGW